MSPRIFRPINVKDDTEFKLKRENMLLTQKNNLPCSVTTAICFIVTLC